MKRIILSTFILFGLIFFTNINVHAQDAKLGAGLAYGTEIEAIGIEAGGVLGFNDSFRGAADVKIFFPDSPSGVDNSFWELNANAHYIFLSEANATVYALGGLNYATQEVSGGGVSISSSEVGLNLGGGAEFGIGFGTIYAELKYAISDFDQLDLSAGLRFGL